MKTSLVLTLLGDDRPGIVEALSRIVSEHDANWEASRMARLAGRFAGILEVTVAPERADALAEALRGLGAAGLEVIARGPAPSEPPAGQRRLRLDLVGNDRPGIVREISSALAGRGVNVEELQTECEAAPMAGGNLFRCRAELSSPPAVSTDELRRALEEIANDLMVEVTLDD